MSTEQNITTAEDRRSAIKEWWTNTMEVAKMLGLTGLAMIFIINGVGVGLYCLDLVEPSANIAAGFGSISLAFAAYVLWLLVNSGVKFHLSNNKRRR